MINVTLPAQVKGQPYSECVTLLGRQPFKLISHSLKSGIVDVVGDQLVINIDSPSAPVCFAAELKSACAECSTITISSDIGYSEQSSACECVVVSVDPSAPSAIASSGPYFASFQLKGTGPFELCGGAAPRCLKITLNGNVVSVSGNYEGKGDVRFSVKNSCSCDCVDVVIPGMS